MKKLPRPDSQHLEAAEGWLGLGCWKEAGDELEQITPEYQAHPYVLELRYKIYSEAKRWDLALEVARVLRETMPDSEWGHFHAAYALHEMKHTQEAYDVLRAVVDKFPDQQFMRFNLACYACVLGNLKEAMEWLKKAIKMPGDVDIRQMALEDRDLQPLWNKIAEI